MAVPGRVGGQLGGRGSLSASCSPEAQPPPWVAQQPCCAGLGRCTVCTSRWLLSMALSAAPGRLCWPCLHRGRPTPVCVSFPVRGRAVPGPARRGPAALPAAQGGAELLPGSPASPEPRPASWLPRGTCTTSCSHPGCLRDSQCLGGQLRGSWIEISETHLQVILALVPPRSRSGGGCVQLPGGRALYGRLRPQDRMRQPLGDLGPGTRVFPAENWARVTHRSPVLEHFQCARHGEN